MAEPYRRFKPYSDEERSIVFEAAANGLDVEATVKLLRKKGYRRGPTGVKNLDARSHGVKVYRARIEAEERERERIAAERQAEWQARVVRFQGYNNGGQPFTVSLPRLSCQADWDARMEGVTW